MIWLTHHPTLADEGASELVGAKLPTDRKLELKFVRTAIGVCFDPLFACVVGQRVLTHQSQSESFYVVLDEILDTDTPSDVWEQIRILKDRYLVSRVFCPTMPDSMVEDLRRLEGLSFYSDGLDAAVASTKWASFVSLDTVAGIVPREVSDSTVQTELNALLNEAALDPKTGQVLVGGDGEVIPKVLFLDDFPVYRTMQSVRTNNPGGTHALYLALNGLRGSHIDRTPPPDPTKFKPNTRRNPTGY